MKLRLLLLALVTAVALSATPTWTAGSYTLEILEENAGFLNRNGLWWYQAGLPATRQVIFNPLDGVGDVAGFTSPVTWGLMLDSPQGMFFSEMAFNTPADGYQHFIGTTVVEIEDLLGGGDRDHNDFRTKVTRTPDVVPEPSTGILLGIGLAILAVFRKIKEA